MLPCVLENVKKEIKEPSIYFVHKVHDEIARGEITEDKAGKIN
jgi:hypothetical protein